MYKKERNSKTIIEGGFSMKKVLLLLMVMILTGCSRQSDENIDSKMTYNDGVYNATVDGYGGDFNMEVTIKDDEILDVVVDENNETPSIGGVAIEQLITQMKENQGGEVEIVSGATKTSQGMINAYKEILEEAKNKAK